MPLVIPQFNLTIPYVSATGIIITLVLTPVALPIIRTMEHILRASFSSSRIVPGPSGGNLFFGHLRFVRDAVKGEWHEQMVEEHGHVIKYKAVLGTDRLFTVDPKALNHIFSNSMIYQKPNQIRYVLGKLLGEGLLFAEGPEHKRQRRIMSPAFSSGHIREMTEIFLAKSRELRDVFVAAVASSSDSMAARVDVLAHLSRTTLDIIGLAGFNYEFNALSGKTTELSESFHAVLNSTQGLPVFQILKSQIPILRYILRYDRASRNVENARSKMDRVGRELVEKKKEAIAAEKAAGEDSMSKSKDLLSLMIRSNMSETGGGLTDEEILHQIPTFLLAGHETTSTSTTWALFSLATHPAIQDRLRSELLTVPTDSPTMGELDTLPYLDAVIREALRYHSVVDGSIRVATKDDIVPLEKPFVGTDGKTRDAIPVSKGDSFFVSIVMMNNSEAIWGEDAKNFNPGRWLNSGPPKATQGIPSVWGNQLTFLAGSRSCIGFKFALIEMKVLLFTLIRSFEFELAVPKEDILRKASIVTRPLVKTEMEKGNQMPMIISALSRKA